MSVSIQGVTDSELSVSFRSTYTSRSLNEKFKVLPRGIVRGFRITPSVAFVDTWTIDIDTLLGESVMNAIGISPTELYSVTYRTVTPITIDLQLEAAGRYFIAFVPDYTITDPTIGEWVAYTEAEFDNGDIVAAGGTFIGVVLGTANTSLPKAIDVLFAGRSAGGNLFIREDMDNFRGDQGSYEKALLTDMTPEPFVSEWLPTAGPAPAFGVTEIHNGGGSIEITATSTNTVGATHPVWQEDTLVTGPTATVIVQAWYKTDGSWNGTADVDLFFYDGLGGVTNASAVGGFVPTYESIPNAVQATWRLLRYEMKIPTATTFFTINAAFAELQVNATVAAGTLYFGRVQMWITHRPSSTAGDFSRSYSSSVVNKVVVAPSGQIEFRSSAAASDKPVRVASASNNALTFDSDLSSGAFTYGFSATGGGSANLVLTGDGLSAGNTSKIKAIGASIETDIFIRTPQLRPIAGTEVFVKAVGGNPATLDCSTMRLTELRSIADGPTTINVRDKDGDDDVTLNVRHVAAGLDVIAPIIQSTSASGRIEVTNAVSSIITAGGSTSFIGNDYYRSKTTPTPPALVDAVFLDAGSNDAVRINANQFSGSSFALAEAAAQWGTSGTPAEDTLDRGIMPVAWASVRVETDAGGLVTSTAFESTNGNYGFSGVVILAGNFGFEATFKNVMANGNGYAVVCTASDVNSGATPIFFPRVSSRFDSSIRVLWKDSAGASIDITTVNSADWIIHLVIFGQQQ